MKKTIILLFIIIVLFASIHFALFLDDVSDITGAHTIEDEKQLQEKLEDNKNNNQIELESIEQTEHDFYDYL